MMNDSIGKKKTVMVVEDYKFTQDLIISLLEGQGYIVIAKANNGKKALDLYRELSPDIVTMDMNMPGMNGLQTIQALLNIDSNARILAITGYKNIEDKAIETGAKGFLVKPFQPKQLYEAVEKILNSSTDSIESEMSQPNPFTEFIQPIIEPVIEQEPEAKEVANESVSISEVWGVFIPQESPKETVNDSSTSYEDASSHNDSKGAVVILSDDDEEDDLLNPSFDFPRKQQPESTVIDETIEMTDIIYDMPVETGLIAEIEVKSNEIQNSSDDIFDSLFINKDDQPNHEDIQTEDKKETSEETPDFSFETEDIVESLDYDVKEETMNMECADDYTDVDDDEIIFILNKPLISHPQPQPMQTNAVSEAAGSASEAAQPAVDITPNKVGKSKSNSEPLIIKPPKSAIQPPKPVGAGTSQNSETEINQEKPKKEKKKFSFFNIFKKNKKGKEEKK